MAPALRPLEVIAIGPQLIGNNKTHEDLATILQQLEAIAWSSQLAENNENLELQTQIQQANRSVSEDSSPFKLALALQPLESGPLLTDQHNNEIHNQRQHLNGCVEATASGTQLKHQDIKIQDQRQQINGCVSEDSSPLALAFQPLESGPQLTDQENSVIHNQRQVNGCVSEDSLHVAPALQQLEATASYPHLTHQDNSETHDQLQEQQNGYVSKESSLVPALQLLGSGPKLTDQDNNETHDQRPQMNGCVPEDSILPLALKPSETSANDLRVYRHMKQLNLLERDHFNYLFCQLEEYATSWGEIGIYLGFSPGHLDSIHYDNRLSREGPKRCLSELLCQLLEWAPGDHRGHQQYATLEALICAVKRTGLEKTAESLNNIIRTTKVSSIEESGTVFSRQHDWTCLHQAFEPMDTTARDQQKCTESNTILNKRHFKYLFWQLIKSGGAPSWKEIGIHLGFHETELRNIEAAAEQNFIENPNGFLYKMLSKWLQWVKNDDHNCATLEAILRAASSAGLEIKPCSMLNCKLRAYDRILKVSPCTKFSTSCNKFCNRVFLVMVCVCLFLLLFIILLSP